MRCAECRLLISKHVDGEADAAEVAHLEEHTAGCPSCLRFLAEARLVNSRFAALEWHEPDPNARYRFEARLNRMLEAPEEEITITRRQDRAAAPIFAPRRTWQTMFGGLATGFALLIVFATGLTILQLQSPQSGSSIPPDGSFTGPVATNAATIPVGEIPSAQSTQIATLAAQEPPVRGGGVASPTAFYPHPEPAAQAHKVRDERFGYGLSYPASWWTSRVAATSSDVLGQRVLKPWTLASTRYEADVAISIVVRDNRDARTLQEVAAHYLGGLPLNATKAGELEVLRATHTMNDGSTEEAILLHAGLIYHFQLVVDSRNVADPAAVDDAWAGSLETFEQILSGFSPGDSIAADHPGAAPLLFLQDGELWSVDPQSHSSEAVARASDVHEFALSPDLSQVAMVTGNDGQGRWGQLISRLFIGSDTPINSSAQTEVHDVAWYDEDSLAVIGGGGPDTAFGLHLFDIDANESRLLARLADLPDARNIQVSPDRLWITFLAGEGPGSILYRVPKDGGSPIALTFAVDEASGVLDYSWLQPDASAKEQRLLVLTGNRIGELTTLPGGTTSQSWQQLAGHSGGAYLSISPEGPAAYLAGDGEKFEIRLIEDTWRDTFALKLGSDYRATDSRLPIALSWMPNSRYLAVQEGGQNGKAVVKLIDRLSDVTSLISIAK